MSELTSEPLSQETPPGPPAPPEPTPPRPVGLLFRIVPPGLYAGRARMLVEREVLVNRRMWLAVVSGLGEPVLYLFAIGLGFGKLAGDVVGPGGQPISYLAFVAPGLLAAAAMNGAVYDSTFNLFFKIKYHRTFEAMLATPLGPFDLAIGQVSWALLRGGLYAVGFFAVLLAMGLVVSPWALLVVPAALLIGFGFAAIGMAATTFMRSWQDFDLVMLALMPMFLFSTTFFPLSVYPAAVRVLVQCFPLYHGIELMRALSAGVVDASILGHVAYYVIMAVFGVLVSARRLSKLLLR